METEFYSKEKLYRGLKRRPKFIKRDNTITRNVFTYTGKNSTGCSVSRQLNRKNINAVKHTLEWLEKHADEVVSILYEQCEEVNIYVKATPSKYNIYHS